MYSMHKKIDNKHVIYYDELGTKLGIAKLTTTGELQPIPDSEPVILFRGRDKLALPMLLHYLRLCRADGATDFQLENMQDMITKFKAFAETSKTMKQPGSTKGL